MFTQWIVLVLMVEAHITTACSENEVFCLHTGTCINEESNCFTQKHDVIGGCLADEVFCLQTGKCIKIEKSCMLQTENNFCRDDETFCLQSGKCAKKQKTVYCKQEQETHKTCPAGSIKCLQTGSCVNTDVISCKDYGNTGLSTKTCSNNEVFCIQSKRCVPRENGCLNDKNASNEVCSGGKIMCLQTGKCVDPGGNCHSVDTSVTCPPGEVMCLKTGKCVSITNTCSNENENTSSTCPYGEVRCLQTGKCVPVTNTCVQTFNCPLGEVMCLHTGKCISLGAPCYSKEVQSDSCPLGEYFCLQSGKCVNYTNCHDTAKNETYFTCLADEIMCLRTGKCVKCLIKDEKHNDTQCTPDQIFCIETGRCISRTNCSDVIQVTKPPDTVTTVCDPGQVMCLHSGQCVNYSCTSDIPNVSHDTTSHTQPIPTQEYDITSHTLTVSSCKPNEIYCFETGTCVMCDIAVHVTPKPCEENCTYLGGKCSDNQVFCVHRGICIAKTCLDKDMTKTTETSTEAMHESETTMAGHNLTDDSAHTTTHTVKEINVLLPEPVFVHENFLLLINETIENYNIESEVQVACSGNVEITNTTGTLTGTTNTSFVVQDKVMLSVTNGNDAECRIYYNDWIFGVHIKVIANLPPPTVNFVDDQLEIPEDTPYIYFTNWMDWYNITFNGASVDLSSFNLSNKEEDKFISRYRHKLLQQLQQNGILLELKLNQAPVNLYGVPITVIEVYSGNTWVPVTNPTVDIVRDRYRIRFIQTCNCQFALEFHQRGLNSDSITIQVIAVNDAPELTNRAILRFSEVVETYLVYPYIDKRTEFRISEFIHQFYVDEDGSDVLGLGVIGQLLDTLGVWEYLLNGSWQQVPLMDIGDIYDGMNVTVHLQGPDDAIRFIPVNNSYLWSRQEAIAYTKLYVLAWDGYSSIVNRVAENVTLNSCTGVHQKVCGPGGTSHFSKDIIALYINRLGCDGVASSLMAEDSCGQCGGHDDCIDCTGTPNGGAVFDMCGDCTGGSSGMKYGHHLDCNNECGNSYYETRLQMCIENGTDVDGILALLSCDKVLKSGAYINKCGYCVMGSTSRSATHGEDVCGVCDGDGSTCLDCDQVFHGNNQFDMCGECLDPSDINFNKGCVMLTSVEPPKIRNFGQHILQVTGVRLDQFSSVECALEGSDKMSLNVVSFHGSKINLLTPVLKGDVVGMYNLSCLFDGNITMILENGLQIYAYLQLTDITPNTMVIGEKLKVKIATSTITNTGYIECALLCFSARPELGCFSSGSLSTLKIPSVILSVKSIQCDLEQMGYFSLARNYHITVLTEPRNMTEFTRLSTVEFIIRAEAPKMEAVTFDKSFCFFNVIFNTEISGPKICSQMFQQDTLILLGKGPICIIVGKRILVDLGKDDTIRPGDTVLLQPNAIFRFGAMTQYADFSSGNIIINTAVDVMQPQFKLLGPISVGSCEKFSLVVIHANGGCMGFSYIWTVKEAQTGNTTQMNSTAYTSLQSRLENLQNNIRTIDVFKDEIQPGKSVEFSVTVYDVFNNKSYIANHIVRREVTQNPVSVSLALLGDKLNVDPAYILRFYAKPKVAECYNSIVGQVRLSWLSDSTDFSLSLFYDRPIAAIRPNTLRGGVKYTVTVSAFLEDYPSTVSDTVVFHTISKPLIVSVRGGDSMVFSADKEVILDAGVSKDPDRQNLPNFYRWTCKYENGFPCFIIHGNDTVLMSTLYALKEKVVIPANKLTTGNKLIWTVTMNVGQRSGSFTTTITIVNILPPTVDVPQKNFIVNPGDKLRIPCTLTSYGPIMMKWSSALENGYDSIDLETILSEEHLVHENSKAVSNWDVSLFIDLSGDTSLPAGGNFVFVAAVFALDNGQGREHHIYVKINSPPTNGDIRVTPSEGTALTTEFTIDIGDGWTDIDDDSTVFYFYVKANGQHWMRLNARGLADIYSYTFRLTDGVYDVTAEMCDMHAACSSVTVISAVSVKKKTFTTSELNQTAESILHVLKADINQAVGMAMTFSTLLVSGSSSSTTAITRVINDVTSNLLTSVVASYDPSDATSVLDSANAMLYRLALSGGMTDTVMTESQSLAYDLASLVTKGTNEKSSRRKKRSVGLTVTPLSIKDATVILTTYSSTFAAREEDSITAESAKQYLDSLDNIFIGLCATVSYAEKAVIAYSELATVNINKRVVENTAKNVYDVSCRNCSTFITHPANITYGASIQDKYTHWNCLPNLSCYGACFATAQITKDVVTPTSPSEMGLTNRVRRSDIVTYKLVNPVEYTIVDVGTLQSPVVIAIQVHGDVNTTAYILQCLYWSHGAWVNTTCTSSRPYFLNTAYTVYCYCYTTGIIALFEGPIIHEATTTADVTDPSTEAVTTVALLDVNIPDSTEEVLVSFIIDADFTAVIGNNETIFIRKIKHVLAKVMNVDVGRIINMKVVEGSIIVSFNLEEGSSPDTTIDAAIQLLSNAILTNNVVITDNNGTTLPIIKSSFTYEVVNKDTVTNGGHTTLYIILGCIAGLLAIAMVVIALLVFKIKKDTSVVMQSPPPAYGPQMRGVDVPRPANEGHTKVIQDRQVPARNPNKPKMDTQKSVNKMSDAGNGSTTNDIDIVAMEKGGRNSGLEGYTDRQKTYNGNGSQLLGGWVESDKRQTITAGYTHSVPGPAHYMPPISA